MATVYVMPTEGDSLEPVTMPPGTVLTWELQGEERDQAELADYAQRAIPDQAARTLKDCREAMLLPDLNWPHLADTQPVADPDGLLMALPPKPEPVRVVPGLLATTYAAMLRGL